MTNILSAVRRLTIIAEGLRALVPGLGIPEATAIVGELLAPRNRRATRALLLRALVLLDEAEADAVEVSHAAE